MYKIEINYWFLSKEQGGTNKKEYYLNLGFHDIEDACIYLGAHIYEILDAFPVESLEIIFDPKHESI
jgi:hypothetical protein